MDILRQSYSHGRSPLTSNPRTQTLNAYIAGGSISASFSPKIFASIFPRNELPWSFHLLQTTDSAMFLQTLHHPQTIGISITMPNKIVFMPLMDEITDQAKAIGAINTAFIRIDDRGRRRYIGANTDCIGIQTTLLAVPTLRHRAHRQPALVIGSGGAARSAVYALWESFRPSEIYIVNRLRSEVDDLVPSMDQRLPGTTLRYVETEDAATSLKSPAIIVGTVPDYAPTAPNEMQMWKVCDRFIQRAGQASVVLDMCYIPRPWTRLASVATEAGCKVILGTEVLVRVCAAQYALWTEMVVKDDVLKDTLHLMHQVSGVKPKL